MKFSRWALLVSVFAIAAASGCDSSTGIGASIPIIQSSPVVYPLNGSPLTLPSGIYVRTGDARQVDASFFFDIAFDIDANNAITVHTVRAVSNDLVAAQRVGLQMSDQLFEDITRAPNSGFAYDSSLAFAGGRTLLVDAFDPNCRNSFLGQSVRAKIAIDSVDTVHRGIYLRLLVNPNCGFRTLVPGTPKD